MRLEAIYHRPKLNWAYAYDRDTLHIRLRTKRGDVREAELLYGDKYQDFSRMGAVGMNIFTQDEHFDYWQAEIRPPYRRLAYGFILRDGKQTVYYSERGFAREPFAGHFGLFEFPFLNPADVFAPPQWVKDAVFYQIFPERFANGDPSNDPPHVQPWGGKPEPHNFFGGDLQGVIDHLDYLAKLGVNAIYFTPIFEAPANHKYDTKDYMKVDPHFGTNETLKRLVDQCHKRGIRVLLDAVFNHSGHTFAPFVDVQQKGEQSAYYHWFHIREWPLQVKDGIPTYDAFAFSPFMPKLNTENPELKQYLLQVARYWVEDIGIDGWRLDVANEVDHAFWRDFRKTVKQANPEAYILGEIWHDAVMWLQGDQFDAAMNYPFTSAVLDFFTERRLDGRQFADRIGMLLAGYPKQAQEVAFNLLDSHDTARLLTRCGDNKSLLKLAVLFQFTFPGTPCIYYGDEIGMTGGNDPDCRKCMVWDENEQDRDLFRFYQEVIALRRRHPVLKTGSLRFLHAKAKDARIAYERKDEHGHLVVLMNAHAHPRALTVRVESGVWTDAWGDDTLHVPNGSLRVQLPAYGYRVLSKG